MKTARILIVDDDPQVLKLFAIKLEKAGYSVQIASSGDSLLRTISESAIDLLIMDLSMPAPDGFELLKELRKTTAHVPVIVVSGYLGGSLLKAAELLGATATLAKTDAPEKLVSTVQSMLQRFPPGLAGA